jgi:hypothetical protein
LKHRNQQPKSHSHSSTDTKKLVHQLPRIQLRQDQTHLVVGRLEHVAVQSHQEPFEGLGVSREVKYLQENQYLGEAHESGACHDLEVVQIREYLYSFDECLDEPEKNYCEYSPQCVEVEVVAVVFGPEAQESEASDVDFDGRRPVVVRHKQELKKC